jgi:hypothetical protein
MSEKIQPSHIERDAYIYIRQSSMQQVRTRLEGQRRQKVGRGLGLTQVPVGYVRTSFTSWAVCVKFCSGIAMRNC